MAVRANCARDQSINEVSIFQEVISSRRGARAYALLVGAWSRRGAADEFFGDILPALALRGEAAEEAGEEDHAQHNE